MKLLKELHYESPYRRLYVIHSQFPLLGEKKKANQINVLYLFAQLLE
jgi:hypothetical protein